MFTPTGVPQYRAPEVLEGAGYSEKNDIWLAGLVLYELLTKKKTNSRKAMKTFLANDFQNEVLTDDQKDLLRNLLKIDPCQRITAAESLKYKWFNKD